MEGTVRVRMIRPAYWTDADLHTRLTADQREFYIGLWMLSDDGGYVAWDVDRVGAELYPYRSPGWRRRHLTDWVEKLGRHVKVLDCGKHLLIPNLPRYQSPPKPSYPNQRQHEKCHADGASGGHVGPSGTSTGREGNRREGNRREPDGAAPVGAPSEFAEKMAALGVKG